MSGAQVSKSFADGKHYNKKAVIQDVHSKRESMLTLDSGKVIESVPQKVSRQPSNLPAGHTQAEMFLLVCAL